MPTVDSMKKNWETRFTDAVFDKAMDDAKTDKSKKKWMLKFCGIFGKKDDPKCAELGNKYQTNVGAVDKKLAHDAIALAKSEDAYKKGLEKIFK